MKSLKLASLLCLMAVVAVIAQASADEKPEKKWTPLFDGSTEGWTVRGGRAKYEIEKNGIIVGTTVEGSPNTFMCKGPYADFELELEVKCDKELNSGIQIRSQVAEKDTPVSSRPGAVMKKGTVYGYQCEIAGESGTSGGFWDEARHGKWWDELKDKPAARKAFKNDEWNKYRIVAQGDHIRSWINGVPCADFHDKTDASGFIGLQVHGIKAGDGPFQVRWRNLRIRELKGDEKID